MRKEPGVMVSLFDATGNMALPWAEAGFRCYCIDVAESMPPHDNIERIRHDLNVPWLPPFPARDIAFVAAFPPCTDLAVSGARWFKGKGLRALSRAINLFATAVEFCEWSRAPYMIENPVSTISTHWRKPDYTFDPYQYTLFCPDDNYTKATCLWVGGGFIMPDEARDAACGAPDNRIHTMPPSPDRGDIRSATPMGFARAVFGANCGRLMERSPR